MVSVVCICRNAERALGRCIKSVADQDYANIEFIIFDGASTDGTVEILRQLDREITFWASEPDKGRNDAFNKALAAIHTTIANSANDPTIDLENCKVWLLSYRSGTITGPSAYTQASQHVDRCVRLHRDAAF